MAQYDLLGADYLKAQEMFFEGKEDPARTFIRRSIPSTLPGYHLLDLGCGGGHDLQYYEEQGATVYGIDESEVMIQHAKQRVKTPQLVTVHDMAKPLPIETDYLHLVVARFSLHYLADLTDLYREVYRVLRRYGQFIFVVEHPIVDLFRSPSKVYGKQEHITIKLYDGAVPITFPTHTLSDYFSATFCRLFTIEDLFEYTGEDAEPTGEVIPNALCVAARSLKE